MTPTDAEKELHRINALIQDAVAHDPAGAVMVAYAAIAASGYLCERAVQTYPALRLPFAQALVETATTLAPGRIEVEQVFAPAGPAH